MRSRILGRLAELSAFASTFLAFPVTSRYASDLVFPLGDYQREFLVPGIPETGITLPLFTASAFLPCGGGCCLR